MFAVLNGLSFTVLWQPIMIVQSIVLQILFLLTVSGPLKRFFREHEPVPRKKIALFISGLWVLYLSFGSPLDYLSDQVSFSAHMVQHMIEIMVLVPLLLAGTPAWLIRPALRHPRAAKTWRFLTHPVVSVALFNLIFFGFHLPVLYEETLVNGWFHFFEHAMFFVAGLLFWWPILSPLPEFPRLKPGPQMLYVFYAADLMTPAELILFFHQQVLYPFYLTTPKLFHLSPIADQQLGFAIMFFGLAIPYIAIAVSAHSKYDNKLWYE